MGALGTTVVCGFLGSIKVQFRALVARDARRCLLSGTQLRSLVYVFDAPRTWEQPHAQILWNKDVT